MSQNIPVITIDGPSGSGKGTVCHLLARELSWHFLDSGALYRVLGLAAIWRNLPLDEEAALDALAAELDVDFLEDKTHASYRIILDQQDITETIRTPTIGKAASRVSAHPRVRSALVDRQRAFRKAPGLIADGRDMGTVIFPDAPLKIFLDASAEERANRRYCQLKKKGDNVKLDKILSDINERDLRDRNRPISPLKPADDAICIDTTDLTADQVFKIILSEVRLRFR